MNIDVLKACLSSELGLLIIILSSSLAIFSQFFGTHAFAQNKLNNEKARCMIRDIVITVFYTIGGLILPLVYLIVTSDEPFSWIRLILEVVCGYLIFSYFALLFLVIKFLKIFRRVPIQF